MFPKEIVITLQQKICNRVGGGDGCDDGMVLMVMVMMVVVVVVVVVDLMVVVATITPIYNTTTQKSS